MTVADLIFTSTLAFAPVGGVTIDFSKFPKLKALVKRVEEDDPKIAAWIKKRPVTQF